ncbi:DNA/RNA non-specific endonuclease [Acinetobacter sp.]|uniref:DNA/RNA non-specific endonuclease n=1 Tax=Acinetobacter sp. TaxID=472 RepID=UPI003917BB57
MGGVAKGKGEEKITDNPQSSSQELSTIHADAGSKGNWDPVLNKTIQPNTRYELSNGPTYMTDNIGRVNQVDGELKLTTMDRNTYQQNCADKCVNATGDDGGHLIASSLGGAGN